MLRVQSYRNWSGEVTLAVSITHALDAPAFVKTLAGKKARTCSDPVRRANLSCENEKWERFAAAPPTAAGRLSESWMVVGAAQNNRGLAQTDGTKSLAVPKPMGFSMARSLRIFECAYHVVLKVERNQF